MLAPGAARSNEPLLAPSPAEPALPADGLEQLPKPCRRLLPPGLLGAGSHLLVCPPRAAICSAVLWGLWCGQAELNEGSEHLHSCSFLLLVHSGIDRVPFSPQLTSSSFLRIGQLSNVDLNEDVNELVSGTEKGIHCYRDPFPSSTNSCFCSPLTFSLSHEGSSASSWAG